MPANTKQDSSMTNREDSPPEQSIKNNLPVESDKSNDGQVAPGLANKPDTSNANLRQNNPTDAILKHDDTIYIDREGNLSDKSK
jgi:hypothetical protein